MIRVTRLNGAQIYLNAILIESIEETPDTIITLTTGKKIIVLEKATDVISLIKSYMRNIGSLRLAIKSHNLEESEEF